jgi:hypothetical protein
VVKNKEYWHLDELINHLEDKYDAEISPTQALIQGVLNISPLINIYIRARKVKPKWDFYTYSKYLYRRISDIRREFNIQIV